MLASSMPLGLWRSSLLWTFIFFLITFCWWILVHVKCASAVVIPPKARSGLIYHMIHSPYGCVPHRMENRTHCMACGILVSPPGIEWGPLVVKARSSNHWTTKGFPKAFHFVIILVLQKSCSNSAEFQNTLHPASSDVNLLGNMLQTRL